MNATLEELVRETMEVTGAKAPPWLHEDSPVLSSDALTADEGKGFYLVGLIGGKEVGKSALVNSLVGKTISASTSHGPGTEMAIAYAHADQEGAIRDLLEREAPGRYRIQTHTDGTLRRQVLLDLPDIDSHYRQHLGVTQKLLRHMLFPIWVSSVEKYADRHAQEMLALVAAGNSPANFLFVLNKADQIADSAGGTAPANDGRRQGGDGQGGKTSSASKGDEELSSLREDYAARIARVLKLPEPPQVFVVSAKSPGEFDLPRLRSLVGQQKQEEAVVHSKQLAARQQDQSLMQWLERQDLPGRAAALARLQEDVTETVEARIGPPLLERAIARLLDDPATQLAMADDVLADRVARWPMVNLVHALLGPIFLLMRSATSRHAGPPQSPGALVDASLGEGGESIAILLQNAFAQLRRTHPALAEPYAHWRLWEQMPAEMAASELSSRLAETVMRQRIVGRERLARRAILGAPLRWLLTLGALLWFPFLQPILEAIFRGQSAHGWTNLLGLIISVLGVNYLLKSAGFLVIWFLVLWLALRWNTQRRVGRLLKTWKMTDYPDVSVNLATQALQWMDSLSEPVRRDCDRLKRLTARVQEAHQSVEVK